MEMKETYTSFQEEVDHKTKKLNKVRTRADGETPTGWVCVVFTCTCCVCVQLRSKLKSVRSEIADQKLEQAQAREELLLTLENLHKEVKLR